MIILSIDVGIKNLAYCVIKLNIINDKINENTIEILDWNIVNLCETLNNLTSIKKIKKR